MSYTQTPNYALYKPTIDSDNDQWGTHLNANADTIDTQLKTIANTAGVISFNTRTGTVSLLNADVTTVLPPSSTTPVMDGTAAVGTGTTWARADHVHPTDTGIAAAAAVATAAQNTANAAQNNVGRNICHNSLFNVAQRGPGPFTTNVYTLDRWALNFASDTNSVTQAPLNDAARAAIGDEAARFALQDVFTGNAAAGAYTQLIHKIEGIYRLSGKTVTLSFWAVAASGTPKIGLGPAQIFGTGGSPSSAVIVTPTSVTLSTTWTRYSVPFALPSAAGKILGTNGDDYTGLYFWLSSGSTNNANAGNIGVQSGTINLWGVQLEVGSVATPLEKPDPRYDLSNCQRFFQVCGTQIYSYAAAGTPASINVGLPVSMRATPTIGNINWATTGNVTGQTIGSLSGTWNNLIVYGLATVAGGINLVGTFTVSADL